MKAQGYFFLLEIGHAAHRGHHSAVAFISRVMWVGSEVAAFSFLLLGSGILSRVQGLWRCQVSVILALSEDRQSPGPCSHCPFVLKCSFVAHSGMFARSSWNSLSSRWKVTYFLREVSLLPAPPTEAATPTHPLDCCPRVTPTASHWSPLNPASLPHPHLLHPKRESMNWMTDTSPWISGLTSSSRWAPEECWVRSHWMGDDSVAFPFSSVSFFLQVMEILLPFGRKFSLLFSV